MVVGAVVRVQELNHVKFNFLVKQIPLPRRLYDSKSDRGPDLELPLGSIGYDSAVMVRGAFDEALGSTRDAVLTEGPWGLSIRVSFAALAKITNGRMGTLLRAIDPVIEAHRSRKFLGPRLAPQRTQPDGFVIR